MRAGFHNLTKEDRTELASRGGRTAHERGTARRWTPEEAREQGRKAAAARAHRCGPDDESEEERNAPDDDAGAVDIEHATD